MSRQDLPGSGGRQDRLSALIAAPRLIRVGRMDPAQGVREAALCVIPRIAW